MDKAKEEFNSICTRLQDAKIGLAALGTHDALFQKGVSKLYTDRLLSCLTFGVLFSFLN